MRTKTFDLVQAVNAMDDDEYDEFLDSLTPAETEEIVSVLERGYVQRNVLAQAVDAMSPDDYERFLDGLSADEAAIIADLE